MAYTKPQQRKKEESERLKGKRDQIKLINLRFERWQFGRLYHNGSCHLLRKKISEILPNIWYQKR